MKKICIVTGSRAEYGLLKSLILGLKKEKSFKLYTIVTGSHLSKFFGNTYKVILHDGIKIDKKVYLPLKKQNNKIDIANITGLAISKFSKVYDKIKPDIILLLGDRYEIFGACFAALNNNILIGHIHGGEQTLGSIDESMRHSITKMSNFHFVSNSVYRRRVIQLGEIPKNVLNVGGLAYENLKKIKLYTKKEFEKKINLKLNKNNFLITLHPETLKSNNSHQIIDNLLSSIKKFNQSCFIFTLSNADAESYKINDKIKIFVKKNKNCSVYFTSMGQKLYYSAIRYCDLLIGNSSSGIIESPYFYTPSVNIGNRQKGRLLANSVINSKNNISSITKAINKAIIIKSNKPKSFFKNPYGKYKSSIKIISFLKNKIRKELDTRKKFYDIIK